MDFGALVEIICAFLAFVGIYCLCHYLSETFFLPKEIVTALKITDDESRENADTLLHILQKGLWHKMGKDTPVLIGKKYENDIELISLIEESGGEYYIIDK